MKKNSVKQRNFESMAGGKSKTARQVQNIPGKSLDREGDETGASDMGYNLVSMLYHLLKSSGLAETYAQDAQMAQDEELLEFFEDCREDLKELAEKAKQILFENQEHLAGGEAQEEESEGEDETETGSRRQSGDRS